MDLFKLILTSKPIRLVSLAFVVLLLNNCTFNPVSLLNRHAREQQQIEIILEAYMASMELRETGLPYLFFSTGLQAIRTEKELAEELSGPGYLAYEKFKSLEVISIEQILVAEDNKDAKQIIAEIRYEDGGTGLLIAVFVNEEEKLVIENVDIFISPDRTCIDQN